MWKKIPDFDYEVSNAGLVRRLTSVTNGKAGKLLKPFLATKGYPFVDLSTDGRKRRVGVHVLVCEAFHGPRPSLKHHAAHWDGDNTNVKASNLRWVLPIDNEADKARHGRRLFGSNSGAAVLHERDVKAIKILLSAGYNPGVIASIFDVGRTTVRHIQDGHTWRHVQ